MFDSAFYTTVFADLVQRECRRQSGMVPVVEFRLAEGSTLDICHLIQLADKSLAVAYCRDPETCEDMDMSFLPYELVVRICVSFHHAEMRRLGFAVSEPVNVTNAAAANVEGRSKR